MRLFGGNGIHLLENSIPATSVPVNSPSAFRNLFAIVTFSCLKSYLPVDLVQSGYMVIIKVNPTWGPCAHSFTLRLKRLQITRNNVLLKDSFWKVFVFLLRSWRSPKWSNVMYNCVICSIIISFSWQSWNRMAECMSLRIMDYTDTVEILSFRGVNFL